MQKHKKGDNDVLKFSHHKLPALCEAAELGNIYSGAVSCLSTKEVDIVFQKNSTSKSATSHQCTSMKFNTEK